MLADILYIEKSHDVSYRQDSLRPASPTKEKAENQAFSVTGGFTSNLEFADSEKETAFVESIDQQQFP